MNELRRKIESSGLKQNFIASKVGVSPAHLSMMLNNRAIMPELVRNKINELLTSVAA